jgi:hypothetical protein
MTYSNEFIAKISKGTPENNDKCMCPVFMYLFETSEHVQIQKCKLNKKLNTKISWTFLAKAPGRSPL